MLTVGFSVALMATMLAAPPPDGKVVRLGVELPPALPEPVRNEVVAAVDEALRSSGLEVVASETICTDPACQQQVLSETGASLGMQVGVTATGQDYQITTSYFDASGVVASDGESCDICRHDEVVARVGTVISRGVASLQPASEPATVSVVSDPSGAKVTIDGVPVGQTPYEGEVGEGSHSIVVEREGYSRIERTVDGAPGTRVDEAFTLERARKISPRTQMVIGWAALGAGVAALAAGVALLVIDEREIQSDCSGQNVDANGVCRYRYDTLAGGAISTAAGVVGVATGVVLVVHGRKRAGPKAQASLRPGGLIVRF